MSSKAKKSSSKKDKKKLSAKGKEKIAKHRKNKQSVSAAPTDDETEPEQEMKYDKSVSSFKGKIAKPPDSKNKKKKSKKKHSNIVETVTTDEETENEEEQPHDEKQESKYEQDTAISSPSPIPDLVPQSFAGRGGAMSAMIREQEERVAKAKAAAKAAKAKKKEEIVIDEPSKVIVDGLEASLLGRQALQIYLEDITTQRIFASTDIRILNASLDACFSTRKSPINFRVEMLWRFTITIADCYYGDRSKNLKMAIYGYNLLLELCNSQTHPFHYAAIHNSLQQAEHELDRLECASNFETANHEFVVTGEKQQDETENIWWNKLANKQANASGMNTGVNTVTGSVVVDIMSDGHVTSGGETEPEMDSDIEEEEEEDGSHGLTMDDEKDRKKKKKSKKKDKKEKKREKEGKEKKKKKSKK